MKVAVLTIAYNDEKNLAACVRNWAGVVDKHLVLVSAVPWHGTVYPRDKSFEIAKELGADAILGGWKSEAEQRNYGLDILMDYDYVLIVDSDEFFTKEDQQKILQHLREKPMVIVGYPKATVVYWKTPEYVLDPTDECIMPLVIDPKAVKFLKARGLIYREGDGNPNDYMAQIDATWHHFSYVRTDEQIQQKLTSYEHADEVKGLEDWYENVWKKWEPGSDIFVRPRGREKSIAVYRPAPQEIIDLFDAK